MTSFLYILLSASALLGPAFSQPVESVDDLVARSDVPPKTPAKQPSIQGGGGQALTPAAPSKTNQMASLDVDTYIKQWMENNQDKLQYSVSTTDGGWESWAQFELEFFIKNKLEMAQKAHVREVRVYEDQHLRADFAFQPPTTSNRKGIILELKCENKNTQGMKALVKADIEKLEKPLVAKYIKDYERAAIAMAYTPKAQTDLEALGMVSLGVNVELMGDEEGKVLRVYRQED